MNTIHDEMKMLTTNIAQKSASFQATATQVKTEKVYEYAFTLMNFQDKDAQELTAAFRGQPTYLDWENWLLGWNSCDYYLLAKPRLIDII